jgi:uncharacterized protein YkwD
MLRTLAGLAVVATAAAVLLSVVACSSGTSSVPAQDILDLINEKRQAAQCPPVQGDSQLRAAADRHVIDMRDNGVTGHTGTDGSTPEQRMKEAGFTPLSKSGEVMYIEVPASTAAKTVDWWMNSPTHRAILLDCGFTHAGVGLLYPGGVKWYAVTDFGKH